MPDIGWNQAVWGGNYDWRARGEEWSAAWGSSEAQWFGSLHPRLHRLLPARRILEIAPGHGRWTRFLIPACEAYLGIDLASNCVDACRERFADAGHARFAQNDGYGLDAAEDAGFELIFSFDSLVHADLDVFERYVPQILAKLAPGGRAFLHHSNRAAFHGLAGWDTHSRSASVSAQGVAELIAQAGGRLLVQEVIDWSGAGPIDCLTLFERGDAGPPVEPVRMLNLHFGEEASLIARFHQPYALLPATRADSA